MAYVEWHEQIRSHYKTDYLMRLLSITRREAVGIIGCISAWTIGHRPGGVLSKELVAIAVEWEKDADVLLKALIESGWLEEFDKKQVQVHDWEEITTGYRKARKDAKRKRDERAEAARVASETDTRQSKDSPKPVHGRKRVRSVHGRSTERRSEQTRTDQTEQTRPTKIEHPKPHSDNNSSQSTSSGSPIKAPNQTGTTGGGAVVAVVQEKTGDGNHAQPSAPESSAETSRVLNYASVRLSTPILEAAGVDRQICEGLARSHPAIRILHVCEHARKQENPGGFVRKALEEGWKVPDSNGEGLAKLVAAVEAEIAARERTWGISFLKRAPDCPIRKDGETDEAYMARVNEWVKSKKSEGSK